MSKIKNGGLDQYGAELFEQQQFWTAGAEGVNTATRRLGQRWDQWRYVLAHGVHFGFTKGSPILD